MNNQKKAIFKAIENTETKNQVIDSETIELMAAQLLETSANLTPLLPVADKVESFHQRINSDKIAGTVESINRIEDLPAAVSIYISKHSLPMDIALQPTQTFTTLDWNAFKVRHQAHSDEKLAISLGQWGIAETGSVVINSAVDSPILLNFLPSHHILVIFEKNIVASLEDYAARPNRLNEQRTACLITGASGTTDIEGVLVNGAHGPEHLHIITIKLNNQTANTKTI